MPSSPWDFIIVGAGSAGCVLADRLSEDGKHKVLLLEAGGHDQSIFIKMPTALSYPMNTAKYNWQFESEAEPHINNRQLHCPRGKVLGGSSSINGMVYVRGHACDFDEWQSLGAAGWSYNDCLPYFKRSENWQGSTTVGDDDYRGKDGPMGTCDGNAMALNPLYQAFIDAGSDAGYPITQDYNAYQQEGFGPMHMTVNKGVRESTATAYLKRARKRSNLKVICKTLTRRVIFENKTAVGVEYQRGSKVETAHANTEVILCAGSVGSPTLLQHSGVGPKDVLANANVKLVHELPGVGENLQDHLEVYFQYYCKQPISLNSKLDLVSKGLIGARWLLFKDGLGSTNHFESCAFIRSKAGLKWPDIQFHFLPAAMRYDGATAVKGHGFQVHVGPNKPRSTGSIKITCNDPASKPSIRFNYLQHDDDKRAWRDCIRLTREIMAQPALDAYRGDEIQPGLDVQSDDAIEAWVRENVESAYHPSCTCKMGASSDAMAVVDSECRVMGVAQLRIVDSSIFPSITNGNLNAPTIMLAEKAADHILGREPLTPANVSPWIAPDWQTQQRLRPPLRNSNSNAEDALVDLGE